MVIFFRVDASIEIGSGHVMRCLVMAHEFAKIGVVSEFITKNHSGNLIDKILENGFKVHILDCQRGNHENPYSGSIYSSWLGSSWENDVKLTIEIISTAIENILIVDHYGIDSRWELIASKYTKKLIVIDDLANRSHSCNLLVDYGVGRKRSDYFDLVPADCKLLTGHKFVILDPLFKQYRALSEIKRKNFTVNSWLISMGGVDKLNRTSDAIRALECAYSGVKINIKVVMGRASPWLSEVKNLISNSNFEIELYVDTKNISKLIYESDCAIGGAGLSSLERAYLGLPSIVLIMAENQNRGALTLDNLGVAKVIYDSAGIKSSILKCITTFAFDDSTLVEMKNNCFALIDGDGLTRVLEAVFE